MATTPSPIIKDDSLLLLQQEGKTFKINFKNLTENIVNVIVNDGGDSPNGPSMLELHDMLDVSTDIYISGTENTVGAADRGRPKQTTKFASRSDINDYVDANGLPVFWMLQWVNGKVGGPHDKANSQGGEFVLRDPHEFFAEGIGGAIELNSLNDVSTRTGSNAGSDFLTHLAEDSFLLCVKDVPVDDKVNFPDYQPRSLTKWIKDNINNPNAPGGGIEIGLGDLIDINPNFDTDGGGNQTVNQGRLALTSDFINQLPGTGFGGLAHKYTWRNEGKKDDDMLVYISTLSAWVDNYKDANTNASGANQDLQPGWYYAQQYFGPPLEEAQLSSGLFPNLDEPEETDKLNVPIGGVRILPHVDTILEDDSVNGGLRIKKDGQGTVPTNISITDDGVLYTTLPDSLFYRGVIDIDAAGLEKFAGADPGEEFVPVSSAGPGGPGYYTTAHDSATTPAVGAFYVVNYVKNHGGPGPTPSEKDSWNKTLKWRSFDADTNTTTNDGSKPIVEDGDLVAWGGERWAVIGTVNTETIAQDLQNVTSRGNFTNKGIVLNNGAPGASPLVNKGLIAGGPTVDGAAATPKPPTNEAPAEGTILCETLGFNQINFDFIEPLA